ncbi:hypothetical protein IJ090_02835 [Candidatus Saccharibacteria bacterium]|nr:hypothetical protein [Candidatus Saccharibacteria bacterium]
MKKINLKNQEYTNQFAKANIYAKKGVVKAVQITREGMMCNAYSNLDVRFDTELGKSVIDTYVMREVPATEGEGVVRSAELEDTRPIEIGEWIATNPKVCESDRDNNYAIPDATFKKRYEPIPGAPGMFRAKGMARIIRNDTGDDVEIEAPWGGPQNGDRNCYFCAPYDKDDPDNLAENDRYILSENDFAAYSLADEVLGAGWNI